MMEQQKVVDVNVRDSWLRKMVKESSSQFAAIQVTTTISITVTIAFLLIVLEIFVNGINMKHLVFEDYTPIQNTPASGIKFSGDGLGDLGDWIAPRGLWHSMSDQELMWRASMVPRIKEYPYNRTPKVAFMFLTRKTLPLAPLWELFFEGHRDFYSIYIHTSSETESVDDPFDESSVFYKRRIPSKPVEWGRATMVDAERRLLANALLDFSNERFILLSESCIPLFNFTTIYDYLIKSNHSFVGSFDDPRKVGRGRYNKRMAPAIQLSDWRKGNQWFELHRDLGIAVVSDKAFYPVFQDHCRPPCYMDEHYLATLVVRIGKGLNSNRSITWVDWSKPGSHPTTFVRKDVSERFLSRVRDQSDCVYNNVPGSFCFLFARKFHPNTLEPLLRIAPVLFGFKVYTMRG